ncbi:MauE/DoxX family redox-associated membrane protein [Micromonospora carbonacea]|uniref:MauE/DoxX family redox-associated membrane protein n=1 Tax=Micromonospora carbonacea TaxID=47853 RepID=UPI003D736DAB
MQYLDLASRVALALIFAVSVFAKIRNSAAFAGFKAGLTAMRVVPRAAISALAVAVVAAEIGTLLALPVFGVAGLLMATALLGAFSAAITAVVVRGTAASCPCFGVSPVRFGRRHLVRNGALMVLALGGAASSDSAGALTRPGVMLAVVAALVFAIIVVAFEDIVETFRPSQGVPG